MLRPALHRSLCAIALGATTAAGGVGVHLATADAAANAPAAVAAQAVGKPSTFVVPPCVQEAFGQSSVAHQPAQLRAGSYFAVLRHANGSRLTFDLLVRHRGQIDYFVDTHQLRTMTVSSHAHITILGSDRAPVCRPGTLRQALTNGRNRSFPVYHLQVSADRAGHRSISQLQQLFHG